MTLKERFIRYVEKQDKRQKEEDSTKQHAWHSRAYHRFFEGYSEYFVIDQHGKRKIERIYTGVFYRQNLSSGKYASLRILYSAILIAATILFFSTSTQYQQSNTIWYVTLPQALCIPSLFWILITLVSYIPAPRLMKISEYRSSSPPLKRAALIGSCAHFAAAISKLIYVLLHGSSTLSELTAALPFSAAGLLLLLMFWLENHIEYEIVSNPAKVPDYGFEIE